MLSIIRRGSTFGKALSALTAPSFQKTIGTSLRHGRSHQPAQLQLAIRALHSSPQWRRYATAEAEAEETFDEAKVENEINSQKPPSDSPIEKLSRNGFITKFNELAEQKLVSPVVVNTLTKAMGLETMTQVQSLTINETLKGIDVLAQARTGTGKTLAFLIPVLQNILMYDPRLESRPGGRTRTSATDIRAIIISPTRELAEQIAVEARKVVANTGVIVQTAVGGSQKSYHLRKMRNEGCHILVGTPGRLNDILSDPYSEVRAPNLSAFVLDEADRLLDQGFAPDIVAIQKLLPRREEVDRQTLLFSATVPNEVMQIVRSTMKPNFKFVRTVQEGEQQTHERVPQKVVEAAGLENIMPALLELCQRELAQLKDAELPFKAIVYFNASAEVSLAASIFNNLANPGTSRFQQLLYPAQISEMHARLSQNERTRTAESFRRAKTAIMFSSDVTARGMDFPNVTHVIQIGIPTSRDTYIHRIGRTARGDKKGEGWLFVSPLETRELRTRLNKLPLETDKSLETATVDMTKDAQLPEYIARTLTQVVAATKSVPLQLKAAAYVASFGVFQWVPRKQQLVDMMNNRSKFGWGLATPPTISQGLAAKLGLSRLSGLMFGYQDRSSEGGDGGFGSGPWKLGRGRGDGAGGRFSTPRKSDPFEDKFVGGGRGRGAYGGDRENGGGFTPRPSRPERSRGSYGLPDAKRSFGRGGGGGDRSSDRGGRDEGGDREYRQRY